MKKVIACLLFILLSTYVPVTFAADSFQVLMNSEAGDYIGVGKKVLYGNTTNDFLTPKTGSYDTSISFELQSFSLGTPINFTFESKDGLLAP